MASAINYVPEKPYIRISPTGLNAADVYYIREVLGIKPKATDPEAKQGYYMKGADDGPAKLVIKRTLLGVDVDGVSYPGETIESYFKKHILTPANRAKGERGARVMSMDELAEMFQTGVAVEGGRRSRRSRRSRKQRKSRKSRRQRKSRK